MFLLHWRDCKNQQQALIHHVRVSTHTNHFVLTKPESLTSSVWFFTLSLKPEPFKCSLRMTHRESRRPDSMVNLRRQKAFLSRYLKEWPSSRYNSPSALPCKTQNTQKKQRNYSQKLIKIYKKNIKLLSHWNWIINILFPAITEQWLNTVT